MRHRRFPGTARRALGAVALAAAWLFRCLWAETPSASPGARAAARPQDRPAIRLLSVENPPVIVGQPRSQGAVVNLSTTLQVYADGDAPLGYFWFKDGAPLHEATNLSVLTNGQLQFLPFLTNDAGTYLVTVSNAAGTATSEPAVLFALPNPYITEQPQSQIVIEGGAAALNVTARASAPVYYYWYRDGVWDTNISLSTVSLLFDPVAATNAGAYHVVVSNAVGTAVSDVATITVKPNTPRQLRTLDLEFPAEGMVDVPIQFASQGDERALSFTFGFNPAVLQAPFVTLTEEAEALIPSARITLEDQQTAQGLLGLTIELAPADLMPTQTFHLLDLHFEMANTNWQQAGLVFGNHPVPLQALGTNAAPLPVLDVVFPVVQPGAMPAAANRQSGVFEQTVVVVNPGALSITGMELLVHGLTNDSIGKPMRLNNATADTNGVPFAYYGPLAPGSATALALQYYVADRRTAPTPVYETRVVATRRYAAVGGQNFAINSVRFADNRVLVEFHTLAGREYFIQYVDDLGSTDWRTALPSLIGTGSRVQWIDDGPPKTISRPTSATSRYYRGMLMP